LIAEYETEPRGVYCGAIGSFSPDGQALFNVAIRSPIIFRDGTGEMGIGSGVVYDSVGAKEYDAQVQAQRDEAARAHAFALERERNKLGMQRDAANPRGAGGASAELRDDAMRAWTAINNDISDRIKSSTNPKIALATPEQLQEIENAMRQEALAQNPHLLSLLPELKALQSDKPSVLPPGIDPSIFKIREKPR
jgi:isochorismate synthase EntC